MVFLRWVSSFENRANHRDTEVAEILKKRDDIEDISIMSYSVDFRSNWSRSSRLRIFPAAEIGRESRKVTARGTLYAAR
jgi:hypothetical protein